MSMFPTLFAKNTLRLGVFILLALLAVQCQTSKTTPPAPNTTTDAATKEAAKKVAKQKADAEKKAAQDKTDADKKAEAEKKAQADKKAADAAAANTTGPWHVAVESVAADQLSLDAFALYPRNDISDKTTTIPGAPCTTQDLPCKRVHLIVTDSVVKDQLKALHKGDHLQVIYAIDTAKCQNTLKTFAVDRLQTCAGIWAMLGSAAICLFLYCLLSGFKPHELIIGEDNRYSNSKFQIALWFFVLIATYIATLWLRVWSAGWDFVGGVDIPKNLLLLSGMSAITFGGAKAITANKDGASTVKSRADKPRFLFDLTHNDGIIAVPGQPAVPAQPAVGNQPAVAAQPAVPAQYTVPPQFDFGDFQMLIITLIAVVTYLVLIFNSFGTVEYTKLVSLPDVDTTLLAAFGLGQGAYLAKKAVGNVGTS
jgi:hypothetical protein